MLARNDQIVSFMGERDKVEFKGVGGCAAESLVAELSEPSPPEGVVGIGVMDGHGAGRKGKAPVFEPQREFSRCQAMRLEGSLTREPSL